MVCLEEHLTMYTVTLFTDKTTITHLTTHKHTIQINQISQELQEIKE